MKNYILIIGLAVAAVSANANLISNGSFEMGNSNDAGDGFTRVFAGETFITDWTVGANSVDWIGAYWPAAAGDRSVDLAGSTQGTLSQSFGTVVGTTYDVSFSQSANPAGDEGLRTALVSALSSSNAVDNSLSLSWDVVAKGSGLTDMKWEANGFSFTASSTMTTLKFDSLTVEGYGIAIDDVKVVEAVPEPASIAALACGLVAIARRRKSK